MEMRVVRRAGLGQERLGMAEKRGRWKRGWKKEDTKKRRELSRPAGIVGRMVR